MTTNRDVLLEDPTTNPIPNAGVAKVGPPRSDEERRVLEWELKRFVCTGEYERGLERVLDSYATHLGRDTQPAVWVSGFYGSGKSHFARVLENLWVDQKLSSGVTARGLVQVPDTITAALKELSTAGEREGGLWSAAGKLSSGSGGSIRLSFLGILFASAGLPADYAPAKLVLRLRAEGAYESFRQALEQRGKSVESELHHMYVSPTVGESLLEAVPGFAANEEQARMFLLEQYPNASNVSEDDLVTTVAEILALQSRKAGKFPCTLVVLDELQQFLDDNPTETQPVIDLVEACSAKFGSSLLFLGTGQSALQVGSLLGKLQDRFTVRVHLTDTDIEEVVRSVVLQKRQEKVPELREVLEKAAGEIDRHLPGTTIAPTRADAADLVPDYPVLPTRRRFWELALRAVDQGGGGLLRSQLRTTHEAAERTANEQIGNVIGADFLYEDQQAGMLGTGALLRTTDADIRALDDGTEDGRLLSRLCATIFLISKLPRETGADAGIRATAPALADLVVTDLTNSSADFRRRAEELLDGLAERGKIQKDGDEYRLQTPEGQEWLSDFLRRESEIRGNSGRIVGLRGDLLRAAVERTVGALKVQQGKSNQTRGLVLHFGDSPPSAEDKIPVWVRDGWSVAEGIVRADAANAGTEDPVLYLYLPKRDADELTRAIATFTASTEVLSARAVVTDEAREARLAMQHRRDSAENRLGGVVDEVLTSAVVLKGGGTVVSGTILRDSLLQAGKDAAVRLYPRFADADHTGWGMVVKRAGEGNPSALEAVSFTDDPKAHPVCKAILGFIGAGKKGSEIRTRFASSEYGWGKDAIDGALLTLLAAEVLGAKTDNIPTTAKQLTVPKIGVTTFTVESGRAPGVEERAAFRAICQLVDVECKSGEEPAKSSELVRVLIDLAQSAGGTDPLPEPPSTVGLEEQQANSGNERVIELAAMTELKSDVERWQRLRTEAITRLASWQLVERLLGHARGLPDTAEIEGQFGAIRQQRTLLAEPDPLVPVRQSLTGALRDGLTAARERVSSARAEARAQIEEAEGWKSLAETDQGQILRINELIEPAALSIGSDEELLASLDQLSLAGWADKFRAAATAREDAFLEVARRSEPDARRVRLPHATLKTPDDVTLYVDDLRGTLETEIASGPIVVS
jgi:hypothetical protein